MIASKLIVTIHRPIDVSSREKEVEERLEQERTARVAAAAREKDTARFGSARGSRSEYKPSSPRMSGSRLEQTPNSPKLAGSALHSPASPKMTGSSLENTPASPKVAGASLEHKAASPKAGDAEIPAAQAPRKEFPSSYGAVRPKFSFAAAASGSGGQGRSDNAATGGGPTTAPADDAPQPAAPSAGVDKITEQVAEVSV